MLSGNAARESALAKGRPVGHEIREAGRRRSNMVAKVPELGRPPPVDALGACRVLGTEITLKHHTFKS